MLQRGELFSKSDGSMREVTIPFANSGGISDWKRLDDSTLLIEDVHGHWYLAKLQAAAYDLAFSDSVGFVTPPTGELGKLSSVIVSRRRYPIVSLTRTDTPVKKRTESNIKKLKPY
jgi:hypothetical protein